MMEAGYMMNSSAQLFCQSVFSGAVCANPVADFAASDTCEKDTQTASATTGVAALTTLHQSQGAADPLSWTFRHPETWVNDDVLHWVSHCAKAWKKDQFSLSLERFDKLTGATLCRMTEADFVDKEEDIGRLLYQCLSVLRSHADFTPPQPEERCRRLISAFPHPPPHPQTHPHSPPVPPHVLSQERLLPELAKTPPAGTDFQRCVQQTTIPSSLPPDQRAALTTTTAKIEAGTSTSMQQATRMEPSQTQQQQQQQQQAMSRLSPQTTNDVAMPIKQEITFDPLVGLDAFMSDESINPGTIQDILDELDFSQSDDCSDVSSGFMPPYHSSLFSITSEMTTSVTGTCVTSGFPFLNNGFPFRCLGRVADGVETAADILTATKKTKRGVGRPKKFPNRSPKETPAPASLQQPGRKKQPVTMPGKRNHLRLWEFIRDMLRSSDHNPEYIRWEDESQGVFRIVRSRDVARIWGQRKEKQMDYANFSRAIRWCRREGFFQFLPKNGKFPKKLCFMFGPRAINWR